MKKNQMQHTKRGLPITTASFFEEGKKGIVDRL